MQTIFFTNGGLELNEIFTEFDIRGTLNMAKTEILQIGNHRPIKITNEYQVYIKQQVKILGLIFSRQGYTETNYKNIIENIRKKADWWKTRQVSLYGKALVINSILLSQLWFAARILTNMSAKTKQTIVQIIFQFLWFPQKIESVKRTTLALPQIQGGLGILDLTTRLQAYKLERFSLIKQTEEIKPWMPLFGYKYDFFLRKHLEIRHLSLTHQEKLKPKDKDLITIYTKYIQANTNTNWNNLKLKQIYLNLIAKQTPPITVKRRKYKTPKEWLAIFQCLQNRDIPNHLREINYKVAHEAIQTQIFIRAIFRYNTPETCRHCGNVPETIRHILTVCYPESYHHLKRMIGSTHTINQLTLDTTPISHRHHFIYSIYRSMIIANHLKTHLIKHKQDEDMVRWLKMEVKKYTHLFFPP